MSSTSTVSPATHGDRSTTLPSPSLARAAAHLVNLTSLDTARPHHPASPSSTSASSASTTTSPTPDSLRHYSTSNIPSSTVATFPAATDFMTMPLVSSPISSVPSTTTSRSPSPGVSPRSEFATTRPIPMKAKKSRNALSVVARALHSLRSSTRSPTKDSRLSLEGMASMADCISKMESLPSVSDVAAALTLTRGVQVEPLSTATATGKSSKADEWHLPTEPVALRGPSKSTTTNNNNNNSSNGKGKTNKKGRLSARAKFLNKPLLSTESANDDAAVAVRGPNSARSINSDVPSERDVLVALTGSPCGKPTSPSRKRKRSVKPRARALSASSNASTVTDIFDEVATPAPTSTTTHTAATAILTPVMESSEQPSPAKMPRRSYAVSTPCTVGCISCQGRGCVRYTSMTLMAAGYTPANSTSTSTSAVGVIRPNTSTTTTTTSTTTPTTAATANKDASATELVAAASAAAAATASGANPPPAARQLTAQEYTQLLALYFERRRRFEAHLKTARGFDMQSWLAGTSPYTP